MPYNLTVGEKFIAYTQRKKKPEKCFSVEVKQVASNRKATLDLPTTAMSKQTRSGALIFEQYTRQKKKKSNKQALIS